MRKRVLASLLTLVLLLALLPVSALAAEGTSVDKWDGTTVDTDWYNGTSTSKSFTIDSAAELAGLAKLVNEGNNFSGKTVTLGANIDLDDKSWTPIGGAAQGKDFKGTFDGSKKTISNLYVHSTDTNGNGFGLFGWSSSGTVKNLTIHNAHVMGNSAVAAIAGESNGTFTNVHVTGKIEIGTTTDQAGLANYNSSYVGGIVGHSYPNPTVTNCSVEGDGIATSYIRGGRQIGGIVGFTCEAGGVTADGCTVKNITIEGVKDVGGIDGWLRGDGITVQNCTVDGIVVHLKNNDPEEKYSLGLISGGSVAINKVCYINNTADNSVLKLNGKEQPGSEPIGYYAGYGSQNYIDKGSKSYDYYNGTLSAAIEKAENGQTVCTLGDVTENITIPADKNLTLDLNGHDLNGTINNEGQLTIKNGTVWGTVTGTEPTYVNASAKTPAAKLGSSSTAAKYESLQEAVDAVAASDADGYVYLMKDSSEDLTIPASAVWTRIRDEGHTLSGNVTNNGNLSFSTSKGVHNWTITNNGKLTLSKNQNTGLTVVNNGTVKITGGKTYDLSKITNNEGGTVSISGGTFNAKPDDAWIAAGYIARQNDDGYKVEPMIDEEALAAGFVARYDSADSTSRKYYKTLSDGFKEKSALHLLTDVNEEATRDGFIDLYCEKNTFTGSLNSSGNGLYINNGTAILDELQCGNFYGGYGSYVANVTVKSGSAKNIKVAKNATVTIEDGTFTGTITVKPGGTGSLTITGGDFAADPTNYIDDDYAVTLSDKPGCIYKVVAKTDDVQEVVVLPAVGKTEAKVDESLELTNDEEAAVTVAAGSVSCDLTDVARQENQTVHNDIHDETTETSVDNYVTDEVAGNLKAEKDKVNLFTQVYLEVVAKGYDEQSVLTLNITPMVQVVATTANKAADIDLAGEDKNAVVVKEPEEVKVTKEVSVEITLPEGLPVENLVIKHTKSDETVEYCSYTVSGQEVTFVTHGFSPVAFSANAAAKITDADGNMVAYPSLRDAVDAVQNGQTITLQNDVTEEVTVSRTVSFTLNLNGKNFTGSINPGANTTMTKEDNTYSFTYTEPTYAVTAPDAENGKVTVTPTNAGKGDTVTITVTPDEGYEPDKLTVTDGNGKNVTLTDKGDGTYTFTMPDCEVTVKATFTKIEDTPVTLPFVDVDKDDYFYEAVMWGVKNGVTNGTSATTFSPDEVCTRGQMVTFLWRSCGSPAPESNKCPFTDVDLNSYYGDAVLWAAENKITLGTGATTFSPNEACTRAHAVTFLWRIGGSPEPKSDKCQFTDVDMDSYYSDAVLWVAEQKITLGTTTTTFDPNKSCTRAEMITFLYRADGMPTEETL